MKTRSKAKKKLAHRRTQEGALLKAPRELNHNCARGEHVLVRKKWNLRTLRGMAGTRIVTGVCRDCGTTVTNVEVR